MIALCCWLCTPDWGTEGTASPVYPSIVLLFEQPHAGWTPRYGAGEGHRCASFSRMMRTCCAAVWRAESVTSTSSSTTAASETTWFCMLTTAVKSIGYTSAASRQAECLKGLVSKHLTDSELGAFAQAEDFNKTSTDRGLQRWEHQHLIAALDTLNAYQLGRKARTRLEAVAMRRQYQSDPRTRFVELMKRWLRSSAASASIEEDDMRRVSALCRDLLNHSALFPARNPQSFMCTIAEVYEHLQGQLREVLQQDRTCAELAQRAITLSRNLLSDVMGYLLLAATDLKQTDELRSVEAVALWPVLPASPNLPVRPDAKLQKKMLPMWQTHCGSLIAAVLSTRWAVRLFNGRDAEADARAVVVAGPSSGSSPPPAERSEAVRELVSKVKDDFNRGQFKNSGLAGAFRQDGMKGARQNYLDAVMCVFDLTYLLGEAFVQFHRVGQGLGDYGMIRASPWLHPFLEALTDKVNQLKKALEGLHAAVDEALVLARARGLKVEKPAPTAMMCSRAHEAIERAVSGGNSHVQALLQVLDELRKRSAPERLPQVMDALGDACSQLQAVLSSDDFFAHVGDKYRDGFPRSSQLTAAAMAPPQAALGAAAVLSLEGDSATLLGCSDDSDREEAASARAGAASPAPASSPPSWRGAGALRGGPARVWRVMRGSTAEEGRAALESPAVSEEASASQSRGSESSEEASAEGHATAEGGGPPPGPEPPPWGAAHAEAGLEPPQGGGMRAEVYRATSGWAGLRRHDRRSLLLSGRHLHIFEKGSSLTVKTVVDVAQDVDQCSVTHGSWLVLDMRRAGKACNSLEGQAAQERKVYYFEFPSASLAEEFSHEIARYRRTTSE